MTQIVTLRASNVEQYLAAVDRIMRLAVKTTPPSRFTPRLWYRGLKSDTYDLLPSIARGELNPMQETSLLSKFKSYAYPYLGQVPYYPFPEGRASYWGWLFLMQHYGVATRLMDWSRDAFVGLLFAVDNENLRPIEKATDPVVWLLNPVMLNRAFNFSDLGPGYIPNVLENSVTREFGPNAGLKHLKPAAVIGPLNNPNIIAQKGSFTVFPKRRTIVALNKFADSSQYLYRIIIPRAKRKSIIEQLKVYGINKADLFPDIDHVAEKISEEWS